MQKYELCCGVIGSPAGKTSLPRILSQSVVSAKKVVRVDRLLFGRFPMNKVFVAKNPAEAHFCERPIGTVGIDAEGSFISSATLSQLFRSYTRRRIMYDSTTNYDAIYDDGTYA
jgi:hypothetical protein